ALSRLAIAFEHYNERHPHSALKYRSPREFSKHWISTVACGVDGEGWDG
ncbi:integrase core domain-containing protein, partial [Ralstonia psammae]